MTASAQNKPFFLAILRPQKLKRRIKRAQLSCFSNRTSEPQIATLIKKKYVLNVIKPHLLEDKEY